jgi:MoaA/NifB/PqqE/SkfB family radical SAM enzyme
MQPTPTTRAVIDNIRTCNIKCKFCYHLHSYDQWKEFTWPFERTIEEIDKAIARGNDYIDFTGGEPTLYPRMAEVLAYCKERNIRTCIITNGVGGWLVSRHGLRDTHDHITNLPGSYDRQINFLKNQHGRAQLRFNCVINHFNQDEIQRIAHEMLEFEPAIVNFINMNPHGAWQAKELETQKVIADLDVVEPQLNYAIQMLEAHDVGVNVRYYPMCRVLSEYRRTICNDLHVVFDPYEWDYNITPKEFQPYADWGEATSRNVEYHGEPCNKCGLQYQCGGANKMFVKAAGVGVLHPQDEPVSGYFYHYRQNNIRTLLCP